MHPCRAAVLLLHDISLHFPPTCFAKAFSFTDWLVPMWILSAGKCLYCPGLPGKISWDSVSTDMGCPQNRKQADSCPRKVTYGQCAHPPSSPACFMMYIHSGISFTVFCSKISGDKTVIEQKLYPSGLGWQFKAVWEEETEERKEGKPSPEHQQI